MPHESNRTLLYEFFSLFDQKDLAVCHSFVEQLDRMCSEDPSLGNLRDYCAAILIHDGTNDFADAQSRYRKLLLDLQLDPFLKGQILISLATAQMQLSDFVSAKISAQTATKLFRKLDLPLEVAKSLAQHGLVCNLAYNAGDFSVMAIDEGIALCQSALNCMQLLPIDKHTGYVWVQVWNTLGGLQSNLLHWAAALRCYETVLTIAAQTNNQYMAALALSNSATIRRKLGGEHLQVAETELISATQIFRQLGRNYELLLTLADVALLNVAMEHHHEALNYFTQALALTETVRASISDASFRAGFLATVSDLFANAVLCAVEVGDLALAFTYMEQARSRAFLDLLADSDPKLEHKAGKSLLTLGQVQQTLPKNAVVFEYFTTGLVEDPDRYKPDAGVGERTTFPSAITLLFVITVARVHVYNLLLSPNDINPLSYEAAVEEHFFEPAMRAMLYTQLIEPAVEHLVGKSTLFVIPHGPLHYVPFQSLLDAAGRTLLQAEQTSIIFSPSASILMRSRAIYADKLDVDKISNLASGSNASLVVGCNGNRARQLAYAEAEAAMVATLTGGHALLGAVSKREQIIQLARQARLVHFSCHGIFDSSDPLQSALQIGADEELTAQQVIESMKLSGPLVTLSACASGLSRVRRGDELFGLVRAFFAAGASALIVTQWRVDERATYLLICKFYELLTQGEEFATALHHAQFYLQSLSAAELLLIVAHIGQTNPVLDEKLHRALAEITDELKQLPASTTPFADPYYWAAFMLIYG